MKKFKYRSLQTFIIYLIICNPISKFDVGKVLKHFEESGNVKLDVLLTISEDPHLWTNQLAANLNIS